MKGIRQSLYARIAMTFIVVLAITTALHLLVFYRMWNGMNVLLEQRLHWSLAEELAQELRESLGESPIPERVQERLYWYSAVNPRLELYVLDSKGSIVLTNLPGSITGKAALGPIERFLNTKERPSEAILGENPRSFHRHPVIFSAASLTLNGQPHYLYAVLQSDSYLRTFHSLGDFTSVGGGSLLLLASIIAASLLGTVLFFLLTRHFRRVTSVVRNFADGNYAERIPVTSDDELGLHAKAFNRMADTIEATIKELAETDRLRRDLVANISHDISNPLAAIRGNLQRLVENDSKFNPEMRRDHLDAALLGIDRIVRLSRELLELSRLESIERAPDLTRVQLADLVTEEIIPRFRPLAERKGVELSARVPETARGVEANADMLERVIANLVENAILYTPPGGGVVVRIVQTEQRVRLEVTDNGIGISEDDLPRIFERFVRGGNSVAPGSGLGLAIAKRTLEVHGGELHVKSKLGEGTTFWFEFTLPA